MELSRSDCIALGVKAPLRESGDVAGSGQIRIEGPCGAIDIPQGVIVAHKHIHVPTEMAEKLGLHDKQRVSVEDVYKRQARTFKVGVATKHMKALTQENTRVIQSVEPISNGTEIIGVLIREKRIEEQYSGQSALHLSHENYESMAQAITSKKGSWLAECIDEALSLIHI